MISFEEAVQIHTLLIQKFGGTTGLRDSKALHSALARPYQVFGGQELYPMAEEKAAAILESIISNHPFIDGNKRVGYVLMKLILLESSLDIVATHEESYDFIIEVAMGRSDISKITSWIRLHLNRNEE